MSKRDPGDSAELNEDDGLVRTTIVGGQPRKRPTIRMSIKVGLERVLYRAAADKAFCKALLRDRRKALENAGMELSAGEAAVLDSVGREGLRTMIRNVRPETRKDHRFMKAVAATFVTLATGTTACEATDGGSDAIPDGDTDVMEEVGVPIDVGILADEVDITEQDIGPVVGGIMPEDVPGVDLDVTEPGADHGTKDDGPHMAADVSHDMPAAGGVMPDIPKGEGVEVDVGNPFDGGSSADAFMTPYPRKP